jgi:hypothetical protein
MNDKWLPEKIIDCMVAGDGGSIFLVIEDNNSRTHTLLLPQHRIIENFEKSTPPGALIMDGNIIRPRSNEERIIIEFLNNCTIQPVNSGRKEITPNNEIVILPPDNAEILLMRKQTIEKIIQDIIAFLKSKEYLDLANKFQQNRL